MYSTTTLMLQLPLELLQEICLHLDQYDIGSLRLTARAFAGISITYMLHTFPFRLSFDGVTRALALTNNVPLASHVRILTFDTFCEEQAQTASDDEMDALTAKHKAVVEQLSLRYLTVQPVAKRKGNIVKQGRDRCLTRDSWKATMEKCSYAEIGPFYCKDLSRLLRSISSSFADKLLAFGALFVLLRRFPRLEGLRINDVDCSYEWKAAGELIVRGLMSPLPRPRTPERSSGPRPDRIESKSLLWALAAYPWPQSSALTSVTFDLSICQLIREPWGNASRKYRSQVKRLSIRLSDVVIALNRPVLSSENRWCRCLFNMNIALRSFRLSSMTNIEELELKLPYHFLEEKNARQGRNDVLMIADDLKLHFPAMSFHRIRKLDLGFFAIDCSALEEWLVGHRGTLRHLKLTRIEIGDGHWVPWFRDLRHSLNLESAEFHGVFTEPLGNISMETTLWDSEWKATSRLGSLLGEICSLRTEPDSPRRERVLEQLVLNMRKHTYEEILMAPKSSDCGLQGRRYSTGG